ncbi:oligopeptide/dipeptide ABC transporter ATP-binding protein [Kitasatospora sp. NPDC087314]|uniref:oligopeptide/dipeptide ABC transporter ATP-binding protein n=1 Tax=Kitasatospora sp. NPDC087314 TaxID=3364068 RepID=UPI00382A6FA1
MIVESKTFWKRDGASRPPPGPIPSSRATTLPPGARHPLGTDNDGIDELGKVMAGGQTSLEIGLAAGLIAAVLARCTARSRATWAAGSTPLSGEVPEHRYACYFPVGEVESGGRPTVVAPSPATTVRAPAVSDGAPAEPLLRIENLVKQYPVTSGLVLRRTVGAVSAVADISLTVRRGETLGLVGESGCGKTTVGKLIVGLERPSSGSLDTIPVADPVVEKAKSSRGVAGELPSAIDPPSGCRFRTRCAAAQQICAEAEPPLTALGPDDHLAACHFPLRPHPTPGR